MSDFLTGPASPDRGPDFQWGEPQPPVNPQTVQDAPDNSRPPKPKVVRRSIVMLLVAAVFAGGGGVAAFALTRDTKSLFEDAPLGQLADFVDEQTDDTIELNIDYSSGDDMTSSEAKEFLRRHEQDQEDLKALLEHFDFSGAVHNRMGQTRALDGTEDAESEKVKAYWTYHPDDGLSVVFEKK